MNAPDLYAARITVDHLDNRQDNKETPAALASSAYLCEYTILSVVLLQDVLESKLDLLLELLHLHLLLEPGSVCNVRDHTFSDINKSRNETAPLNWREQPLLW